MCDSEPALDGGRRGGCQVASQRPAREAAQTMAVFGGSRCFFQESQGNVRFFSERSFVPLLNTYYEPGTVQGFEDTVVNKTEMVAPVSIQLRV